MSYIHSCYGCGAPCDSWLTRCSTCRTRESIEESSRASAKLERELAEQAAENVRTAARIQQQNTAALISASNENARLAREQAALNARMIVESNTSYDDAYQYGLNYLRCNDDGYRLFNTGKIDIYYVDVTADLNGDIKVSCPLWTPYELPHLNQAFERGLADSVPTLGFTRVSREKLKAMIYNAGWHFETSFSLPTGQYLPSGREITTQVFNSDLKRHVDENTGDNVAPDWYSLVVTGDSELDSEYRRGVSESLAAINTPENREINLRWFQENREEQARATEAKMKELADQDRADSIKKWSLAAVAIGIPALAFVAVGTITGIIVTVVSAFISFVRWAE
jgi:hypothetical protein